MDTLAVSLIETISKPETYQDSKTIFGSIVTAIIAIAIRYFELRRRNKKGI